jgi:hypothetical protein
LEIEYKLKSKLGLAGLFLFHEGVCGAGCSETDFSPSREFPGRYKRSPDSPSIECGSIKAAWRVPFIDIDPVLPIIHLENSLPEIDRQTSASESTFNISKD